MTSRVGVAAVAPVLALIALVTPAALPGPSPAPPVPASIPTTTVPARDAEVEQILSDLSAVDTDAGLVVPLPEQVLFDFNRADVRDDAKATLAKVAEVLAFYRTARVEVRGHTDDEGTDQYNQGLSERRAAAVRDHLVTAAGVDASRFVVRAYGESQPLVANDTDANRQRNRRVEVVVLGA